MDALLDIDEAEKLPTKNFDIKSIKKLKEDIENAFNPVKE